MSWQVNRRTFLAAASATAVTQSLGLAAEEGVRTKTYTYKTVDGLEIKADVLRPDDEKIRPVVVWIHGGALNFDGTSTYCVLADRDLKADYEFTGEIVVTKDRNDKQRRRYKGTRGLKKGQAAPKSIYPGNKRRTVDMETTNLLIEMVFKTEPGLTGAVLVSKLSDQAGYMLDLNTAGNLRLTLRAAGADSSLTGAMAVNDGKSHHVIAEVDRAAAQGITIYVDGRKVHGEFAGAMPAKESSLSNAADLLVGKGPSGKLFAGAMDFLRICRGTLADAETTIEELYAWQFDGPQTRDFAGRKPTDGKRDAGAIEYRE
jgi:hypothetical protein